MDSVELSAEAAEGGAEGGTAAEPVPEATEVVAEEAAGEKVEGETAEEPAAKEAVPQEEVSKGAVEEAAEEEAVEGAAVGGEAAEGAMAEEKAIEGAVAEEEAAKEARAEGTAEEATAEKTDEAGPDALDDAVEGEAKEPLEEEVKEAGEGDAQEEEDTSAGATEHAAPPVENDVTALVDDAAADKGEVDPGDAEVADNDSAMEAATSEPKEEAEEEDAAARELAIRQAEELAELNDELNSVVENLESVKTDNSNLQRRVVARTRSQKDKFEGEKAAADSMRVTEHKYLNVLHHVHTVRLKLRQQQVKAAKMSEELKNQLEEKRQKAMECRDAFRDFKRQVALNAEYSRTGKRVPPKILQEIEDFEQDKDAEVEEVRGSNISLKNRLAKLELQLRKKDELADNLHVIDFEQLKIENQTLNERIEERNEDLHKLRKKTVITVQFMTHMREKLQCIVQENQVLKTELAQLEQELAGQRDLVGKTKHERDDFRAENAKLRQQTGLLNSRTMNEDYESRSARIAALKESLTSLKGTYATKIDFIKANQGMETM